MRPFSFQVSGKRERSVISRLICKTKEVKWRHTAANQFILSCRVLPVLPNEPSVRGGAWIGARDLDQIFFFFLFLPFLLFFFYLYYFSFFSRNWLMCEELLQRDASVSSFVSTGGSAIGFTTNANGRHSGALGCLVGVSVPIIYAYSGRRFRTGLRFGPEQRFRSNLD